MGWHSTRLLGRDHDPDPDHIQDLWTDAAREKQSFLVGLLYFNVLFFHVLYLHIESSETTHRSRL